MYLCKIETRMMKPEIICYCGKVTRFEIERAIKEGAKSIEDIRWTTNACKDNRCKTTHPEGICCEAEIKKMIVAEHGCLGGHCSCCG